MTKIQNYHQRRSSWNRIRQKQSSLVNWSWCLSYSGHPRPGQRLAWPRRPSLNSYPPALAQDPGPHTGWAMLAPPIVTFLAPSYHVGCLMPSCEHSPSLRSRLVAASLCYSPAVDYYARHQGLAQWTQTLPEGSVTELAYFERDMLSIKYLIYVLLYN